MGELVTITSGALTAAISPIGAELWALTDAQGCELMTDADPRWWTGHAPLLFPFTYVSLKLPLHRQFSLHVRGRHRTAV